jgi:hypothetical protein
VRGAVVEHLVVDLVGEDDELVLAGDLDDLAQQSSGYSAPVGLFGLMSTMARVDGPILPRMSARSGSQPAPSSHR